MEITIEQLTKEFFHNNPRGQALLIHEAKREFAKELERAIALGRRNGVDPDNILRFIVGGLLRRQFERQDQVPG